MKRFVLPFLWLLGLGACSNDLPKAQLLDRLRVLALIANNPEVSPGGTFTLSALISDVRGGTRTLSYTLEMCRDPGLDYGATAACDHDTAKQTLASTAVTFSHARRTEAVTIPGTYTVPATLFTDAKTDTLSQYNGANYLVIFTLTASDGEVEKVFRRIKVSLATKPVKNTNPTLTGITLDTGAAQTTVPTTEKSLLVTASGASAEAYQELETTGAFESRTETLVVSWFASEGLLETATVALATANKFTPATTLTYPSFLIAVLRDERGGSGFLMLTP